MRPECFAAGNASQIKRHLETLRSGLPANTLLVVLATSDNEAIPSKDQPQATTKARITGTVTCVVASGEVQI